MGQADHARTTRRGMLAATFALSTAVGAGAVLAAEVVTMDAALLALEPELARLVRAEDEAISTSWLLEKEAHALADARVPNATAGWSTALEEASHEVGHVAAQEKVSRAILALTEACADLGAMRARTLDGLCMKARFAEHCERLADSIVDDLLAMSGLYQGGSRATSI